MSTHANPIAQTFFSSNIQPCDDVSHALPSNTHPHVTVDA